MAQILETSSNRWRDTLPLHCPARYPTRRGPPFSIAFVISLSPVDTTGAHRGTMDSTGDCTGSLHAAADAQAPPRNPLVPLDQFPPARDHDLERNVDLLGVRAVPDRFIPFLSSVVLCCVPHRPPASRRHGAAFRFHVAVPAEWAFVCRVHDCVGRVAHAGTAFPSRVETQLAGSAL